MSLHIKILSFTFLILFFTSCQSVTRFTTDKTPIKKMQSNYKNQKINNSSNNKDNIKTTYLNMGDKQRKLLNEADKWMGTRYCYGGEDENCVDCSGFVQNVFAKVGVNLPRTAQLQYNYTLRVQRNEIEPGDLIFFEKRGTVNHVGIYLGNSEFIHASTTGGVVHDNLDRYSTFHEIAGYGRALR